MCHGTAPVLHMHRRDRIAPLRLSRMVMCHGTAPVLHMHRRDRIAPLRLPEDGDALRYGACVGYPCTGAIESRRYGFPRMMMRHGTAPVLRTMHRRDRIAPLRLSEDGDATPYGACVAHQAPAR